MKKRFVAFMLICVMAAALAGCSIFEGARSDVAATDPAPSSGVPEETDDGLVKNPIATIEMESGDIIKLELYPDIAPNTVANFVTLANSEYYDGLIFHRVVSGFMIQGGSPNGTSSGGPGYTIKGEFTSNGFENNLKHTKGVISMARTDDPDSAGSQFFIMHADASHLDGKYAAFGKTVDSESDKIVNRIALTRTDNNSRPVTEWRIKTIRVETFGAEYVVEKIN